MTTQTSTRTRSLWPNARTIIATAKTRRPRPTRPEQPRPATKTQAEKEADRWVAQMMFEHYNG